MNISIVSDAAESVPVILVLTGGGDEQEKILDCLNDLMGQAAFAFLSGFEWNRDLSPWPAPAAWSNTPDFSGGADLFLRGITEEIQHIPDITGFNPLWYGIAGYSLAGLFAVYSLYRTDVFTRAVSASGSMWYDGFCDFALGGEFAGKPESVYFSLGSREHRTGNRRVAAVESSTRIIFEHYRKTGIRTVFEINPGNHFQNPNGRLAKGIRWILKDGHDGI